MIDSREAFLQGVRHALGHGRQAGAGMDLPARGAVGKAGPVPDLVQRFCRQWNAAGGRAHVVRQRDVSDLVVQILTGRGSGSVLLNDDAMLGQLQLGHCLEAAGIPIIRAGAAAPEDWRSAYFGADAGISCADQLIAETGTAVITARRGEPRSVSLLPPLHIVVAARANLLADLFDLFEPGRWPDGLPSCVSLITGPSKTGDIELRLVTGVHGPGEIHAIIVDDIV
jgi:L-lactate dehydrogenase complex protein LldG